METGHNELAAVEKCVGQLHAYIKAADYAGHDPYDGLQSRIFRALPFSQWKWSRVAMIQAMKRSPWNLRGVLGVPRERNPKGVALCVSALSRLARADPSADFAQEARQLLDWLTANRSPGYSSSCWGYNFDWQSRSLWAPRTMPNIACSIAVAEAFLDAHEQFGHAGDLETARSTCTFLREHLLVRSGNETYFRYVPGHDVAVYNVSLQAVALLARTAALAGDAKLRELAAEVAEFSVRRQKKDGSWDYGESHHQRWTDNFHTGFSLVGLSRYCRYTGDARFRDALEKGRIFWEQNFFAPDGAPKYYPDALFPVDIHSSAQSILTHLEFSLENPGALEKAQQAAGWVLGHLWSGAGYFYFQIHRGYTIRIPYMRWSQMWMFYALASLLASRRLVGKQQAASATAPVA